jgi:hypothetical protein
MGVRRRASFMSESMLEAASQSKPETARALECPLQPKRKHRGEKWGKAYFQASKS